MDALNLSKDDRVKLKACAHCGGKAGVNIAGGGFGIFCNDCGVGVRKRIHPGIYLDWRKHAEAEERLAVLAWNRRHDETPSEFERLCGKENSHV
ncbi:hypothetical protein GOL29_03250 [Sinorhizobium medicae]|nr:hypothetical protein [Sinorhizobium medicae]